MHLVKFTLTVAGLLFINSICPAIAVAVILLLMWKATASN